MNFEKASDWFWDIAKYVITGIIITSFLGGFEKEPTKKKSLQNFISQAVF